MRIRPSGTLMLTILRADGGPSLEQVRELIVELAAWDIAQAERLHLDPKLVSEFCYASIQEELPGVYAPPGGSLFLAMHSGKAAGCVAFRRLSSDTCEMKRMYVRPEFRGMRLGRGLVDTAVQAARESGYKLMRLETITAMDRAIALYCAAGFRPCQPYYAIPESFLEVTIFMELRLTEREFARATSFSIR
jgi:ribosomal protein S18 acetylase RimI-like enzyme